jgi:hypothetical protein
MRPDASWDLVLVTKAQPQFAGQSEVLKSALHSGEWAVDNELVLGKAQASASSSSSSSSNNNSNSNSNAPVAECSSGGIGTESSDFQLTPIRSVHDNPILNFNVSSPFTILY